MNKSVFHITLLILIVLALLSCDLDNFSPAATLNPTLLLSLSNTPGGDLAVTFTAQNSQEYCKGYNIYLGSNINDVTNQYFPLTNVYGTLPTIYRNVTFTTNYTYIISNNNSGWSGTIAGGGYVGVAAWGYDSLEYITSPILIVSSF